MIEHYLRNEDTLFDFHDFISSWSHLLMAGFMMFVALLLLRLTRKHPLTHRLSVLFYAGTAVMLFTLSGFFHGIRYLNSYDRRVWQLLDQTAIFFLIYGSNVPLLVYLLPRPRRNTLLILMGLIAIAGSFCLWLKPAHEVLVPLYIGIGLAGLWPMRTYFQQIGWWGTLWVFIMAGTYIVGAVCEVASWPVIVEEGWMKLSYHELFHLFVIAGTLAHTVLIIEFVIPTMKRKSRIPVDLGRRVDHNHSVAHRAIPPAMDRL